MSWRQKLFVSWIAPRGIVSASVASLFAILLTQRGISGGEAIKALVFLTILSTVFVQGLSARWVAKSLGITSSQASGAVIVGCNPLGLLMARLFRERGETVVMIDTDPTACQIAEQEEDVKVFTSSALDTKVLEQAGLEQMGTFLAMTTNAEVNLVLAQRAAEEFSPPWVVAIYQGESAQEGGSEPTIARVQRSLISQSELKNWNRYLSDREVRLGETMLRGPDLQRQQEHLRSLMREEKLLPLLIQREEQLKVAPLMEDWKGDDRLLYLFHDPKPKTLKRLTGMSGSDRLNPEKLPEVEQLPPPSETRDPAVTAEPGVEVGKG